MNWVYRRSKLLGVLFNMLARTPAYFLVYMESCVGAFGPSGRGCLPGCLEGGQKCPQNVRSIPFLVLVDGVTNHPERRGQPAAEQLNGSDSYM